MKRLLLGAIALLSISISALRAEQNGTTLPTFHTLSVSPHYGQMHYDISLCHLQDPDFDQSVHITYTSDGFRPFIYSGTVGENWSLQAGGSITREIIGIADDDHTMANIYDTEHKGLLVLLRDSSFQHPDSKSLYEGNFSGPYGGDIDWESDIYTFSCQGYSGQFIIGLDGKAHIVSGDYVSVDLSAMTTQVKDNDGPRVPFFQLHPDVSTISFTTLDGYRYVFGGDMNALGYSFCEYKHASELLYQKADITQWMLTSIIAPNGRRMKFHYRPVINNDSTRYAYSSMTQIQDINDDYCRDFYLSDTLNLKAEVNKKDSRFWASIYGQNNFEKILLLDSITTSDHSFSIYFQYEILPNQLCDNGSFYWAVERNTTNKSYWTASKHFLSRVTICNATSELGHWDLAYNQLSVQPITRQYLQSVTHSSGIQYAFDYNIANGSIDRFDSIDIAGYKISDPTFGTLARITDPLGCITTLAFQPCRYDSIRILKQEGLSLRSTIQAYPYHDLVHPIAITAIQKVGSDGRLLSSKRYKYGIHVDHVEQIGAAPFLGNSATEPSLPLRDKNFGIANVDFAIDISSDRAQTWSKQRHYAVCLYFTSSDRKASPIEFPMVNEYIYGDDKLLYQNTYIYDRTEDLAIIKRYNNSDNFHNILGRYSYFTQEHRRNRLSISLEYDDQDTLRRQVLNHYCSIDALSTNVDDAYFEPCATSWRAEYGRGIAYKVFFSDNHIAEQQVTNYETNGVHSTRTTYQYDARHRLTRKGVWQGDTEEFSLYRYPDDICTASFNGNNQYVQGYCGLVRTHRIATPIETMQGVSRNGQSFVTAGELVMYYAYNYGLGGGDSIGGSELPDFPKLLALEDNQAMSLPLYYAPCGLRKLSLSEPIPISDYIGLSVQEGQLRYDSRYETTSAFIYNSLLRLTSSTSIGQPATTYKWDDKGLYILSETTGALTTRYTYIPHVGVASVTSPRGITTYYSYDTLGNVTEIYQYQNGKKVILRAYKYHYHNQQQP